MSRVEVARRWQSLATGKIYEAKRVTRIDIAQQSMSIGENHLYQVLWSTPRSDFFRVLSETKFSRQFCAGYDVIARIARLNEKSVRDLLPKLKQKMVLLELAQADPTIRKGKTYELFSYQQILTRQRNAGLCFAVNNGKAVEFAVPAGQGIDAIPTVSVGQTPSVGRTPPVGNPRTESEGLSPTESMGQTPTLLDTRGNYKTITTSTSAPRSELITAFEHRVPGIDVGAVGRIWTESGQVLPDRTPEEVLALFDVRAPHVFKNRNLHNPMGVILTTIKAWFTAQKVLQMRERTQQEAEETAKILEELEKPSVENQAFHRKFVEDRIQFLEQEIRDRSKDDPDHPRVLFIRKELADLRAQLKQNQ